MPSILSRFALAFVVLAGVARADEDVYYRLRLDDVKFVDGARPPAPKPGTWDWRMRETAWTMLPYVALDAPGEAYVATGDSTWFNPWSPPHIENETILARSTKGGELTGRLYYPKPDWSGMVQRRIVIPASAASEQARAPFLRAKQSHYRWLMDRDLPGAAYYRYQIRQVDLALRTQPDELRPGEVRMGPTMPPPRPRDMELTRTFELMSGGRAVSENLQLDRPLGEAAASSEKVRVDSLSGISVAEIDWAPLVKDLKPATDPLAAAIPADQHAVFFPSFSAFALATDEADRQGTPILDLAEPRSEDAMSAERYQRQLGLSLSTLGRMLGPHVVKSVALTGSDPYYRTGTDVAVLFEAAEPAVLEKLLMAQITLSAATNSQAKVQQGTIAGLTYSGFRSPDRKTCSYIARLDGAVVVTNSPAQLERLAEVANKKAAAIDSLPEYTFFRNRYPRGDADETALVFLSDATIRRWCGPRWRIAASRRTRDMGVLADLQAAQLDPLARRNVKPGVIHTEWPTADVGELSLESDGVHSSVLGGLEFMTPIAEIPLEKVSAAEAEAYRRWRDNYQSNWRWAFDPIALRITMQENRLAADVSVIPLIWSDNQFAPQNLLHLLSNGASLDARSGDPHDALLHFVLAINKKSPLLGMAENFMSSMAKGVTLGWLGSGVAVYIDDDPLWAEAAKVPPDELDKFMEKNYHRLPLAVRFEVSNGLRLTAFLAALRAYIDQTTPDMTRWETLTYKDQPYVKVTPSQRARGTEPQMAELAIYYAASGDALLVTLNEKVLQRAIDRQLAGSKEEKPTADAAKAWLGQNVALSIDHKALAIVAQLNREKYQTAMQVRAWGNLPILNIWHRLYPDQDPVELHQRLWHLRLRCPGGGKYVWNERWQTMESTVYGHPGEPKAGPAAPAALNEFDRAAFGLTFENDGLRARVELRKTSPSAELKRDTRPSP